MGSNWNMGPGQAQRQWLMNRFHTQNQQNGGWGCWILFLFASCRISSPSDTVQNINLLLWWPSFLMCCFSREQHWFLKLCANKMFENSGEQVTAPCLLCASSSAQTVHEWLIFCNFLDITNRIRWLRCPMSNLSNKLSWPSLSAHRNVM
jgi:hypothetical protein